MSEPPTFIARAAGVNEVSTLDSLMRKLWAAYDSLGGVDGTADLDLNEGESMQALMLEKKGLTGIAMLTWRLNKENRIAVELGECSKPRDPG